MQDHEHIFIAGPFYVLVAITVDEPEHIRPQGVQRVEHCLSCGILKLPDYMKDRAGANLNERTSDNA